jgi:hypothetical protein
MGGVTHDDHLEHPVDQAVLAGGRRGNVCRVLSSFPGTSLPNAGNYILVQPEHQLQNTKWH